MSSTSSKYFL